MKQTKKQNRMRGISMALAVMLFAGGICGCGTSQETSVPKLEEPVALNEAYRPAEYADVGTISVLFGTVVPMDYYQYYHTNVSLAELNVGIGDYVQKGDVIATADIEEEQERLKEQQEAIDQETRTFTINQQIVEEKIKELLYQKEELQNQQIEEEEQDSIEEQCRQLDTQIASMREDQRYDTLLHEYRISRMQEQLKEIRQVIADGTLKANHDGYVTFIKDLMGSTQAGDSEIVAILSDFSDQYIQLDQMNVSDYAKYEEYEVKYLMVGSERYDVEELDYTSDELIMCKANGKYPNVRIRCPEGADFSMGDSYPIYYIKKDVRNVLTVANDSIYDEEGTHFVYVKNEYGEREKREVTIGSSDDNYTEITDGLQEGELVYYQSDSRMPADYTEYTVELGDFQIKNQTMTYQMADAASDLYRSQYSGKIVEIAVEKGQDVKAGDLLYVIDVGEGKAALVQADNAIQQEMRSYEDTCKYYETAIGELEQKEDRDTYDDCELQILKYQKELDDMSHESTLAALQENYDTLKKGNDGTGQISVYAGEDGTVSSIAAYNSQKVEAGTEILIVSTASDDLVLVTMKQEEASQGLTQYIENIADLGETVSMVVDGETWTGTCIGWANGSRATSQNYVATDEGTTVLPYCGTISTSQSAFYIRMDDESYYENMPQGHIMTFSYLSMKDVIVLPTDMICTETRSGSANKQYYYVWRIVDGEMVKQYILIDSDNLSTRSQTVVLSGLKQGDVLAVEY